MHLKPRSASLSTLLLLCAALALVACGDDSSDDADTTGTPDIECPEGTIYNAERDRCVVDISDVGEDDADTSDDDAEVFIEEDTGPPPGCDEDNDGVLSQACGGNDCDDNDFERSPDREEVCDDIDNNCNGGLNEDLICSFYAHTPDALYEVDPYLHSISLVAELPSFGGNALTDIDTHPDGTLYGVTQNAVHLFVPSAKQWFEVDRFDSAITFATGLAFDVFGVAFITASNELYTIDVELNVSESVGLLGTSPDTNTVYESSGDCVVDKFNSLFMTSKHRGDTDVLVIIDRHTAQTVEVGPIGYTQVYGLTFSFGTLYGLTTRGELIKIDTETGAGELEYIYQGDSGAYRFYGAASTPNR